MAQYCAPNAAEMTSIVFTEFTKQVNLRQFFVPQEVLRRLMTVTMLGFFCVDNPVSSFFSPI
jgi:hypothetical protein